METAEIKLARFEERLAALCQSVDFLRGEMIKVFTELKEESSKRNIRLAALEADAERRKGGKAVLVAVASVAGAVGGFGLRAVL